MKLLKSIRRLVANGGWLLILQTASLDLMALRSTLCGELGFLSELDEEYVLVERPRFRVERSIFENRWVFL